MVLGWIRRFSSTEEECDALFKACWGTGTEQNESAHMMLLAPYWDPSIKNVRRCMMDGVTENASMLVFLSDGVVVAPCTKNIWGCRQTMSLHIRLAVKQSTSDTCCWHQEATFSDGFECRVYVGHDSQSIRENVNSVPEKVEISPEKVESSPESNPQTPKDESPSRSSSSGDVKVPPHQHACPTMQTCQLHLDRMTAQFVV